MSSKQTVIDGSVREYQKAIANTDWINSFESIINFIDPYGTPKSGSLKQQWTDAFYTHEDKSFYSTDSHIYFAQKLGVIKSLLFGKAKITLPESEKYISKCIFHKRDLPPQSNLVFVLMPFIESWSDEIWHEVIKPSIHSIKFAPLVCKRADDLFGVDVMQDIYESILTARIIIAEITGRNANVFYELGISHSLGKDVILLSQGATHIPFDLNRFRHCIYENSTEGHVKVKNYLEDSIKEILSKNKNSS